MSRSSTLSHSSQPRRNQSAFPALQTRGSSTISASSSANDTASPTSAVGTASFASLASRKKGPSLSFAANIEGRTNGEASAIHPLQDTWNVWVSHRSVNGGKGGKKDDQAKTAKEKESREEWEGAVVKLGGFSSIESMYPFLAHLTAPSDLPSSIGASTNTVTDYNVFRAEIAPAWEDEHNSGGGRWVMRLRKGVADRVWEEVVWALVGERIGTDDDRTDSKVNGVVLSVRKDEDILSLWVAPSSRIERDQIRESLRASLEPLLGVASLTNVVLDYKPHPGVGGAAHAHVGTPRNDRHRTDPAHRSELRRERERSENGTAPDGTPTTREGSVRPRLGDRSSSRTGTGFSAYVSRAGGDLRDKLGDATAIGTLGAGVGGGGFGRPRRGSVGKEGEGRASSATSWGRV